MNPNESIMKIIQERNELIRLIVNGFAYDPGHSDLDNEQPIYVRMTLGDYRKVSMMQ